MIHKNFCRKLRLFYLLFLSNQLYAVDTPVYSERRAWVKAILKNSCMYNKLGSVPEKYLIAGLITLIIFQIIHHALVVNIQTLIILKFNEKFGLRKTIAAISLLVTVYVLSICLFTKPEPTLQDQLITAQNTVRQLNEQLHQTRIILLDTR